jgi:CheY-like chemotaxis protein
MLSVLVVDDDTAVRSVLVRYLQHRGCEVVSAPNGLDGAAQVRRRAFDIVISDVSMPGHGGLWLWEQALAMRPELHGRFMLMSATPLQDNRRTRLFLESERFLPKPFLLATLWGEMQKIVELVEGERQQSA